MSMGNELATTNGNGAMVRAAPESPPTGLAVGVSITSMAEVFRLAEHLARADGFVPRAYQGKPAAVAAIILTGIELGLGPMMAMREVHLIEGKPTLSATLMLTLARRAGVRTRFVVSDATKATIEVTVPGTPPQQLTFSVEDAKAAGLWGKGNWSKHPAAMLRARAISGAIRAFCPEAIGGSVYESESGEITGGVPSVEVVEAVSVEAAPVRAAASGPRLAECSDAAALEAWCRANGERAAKTNRLDAVMDKAAELEVDLGVVRSWCGIVETAAVQS